MFPSPSRIRITQDTKWLERNTDLMYANLERTFEKQAKPNKVNQKIRIGHKARSTYDAPGALWVQNFTGDGVTIDSAQVKHAISMSNERLAGTGWRVVDIVPVKVPTTQAYKMNRWYNSWMHNPDVHMAQYFSGEVEKPPMPMMPALDVVLEYVCDTACTAPTQKESENG